MKYLLHIEPVDTLFLRNAASFIAGESNVVKSMFPPTASTGYGFARAFLLKEYCSQVMRYVKNGCNGCTEANACSIHDVVGSPSKRDGTLSIIGPYVLKRGKDDDEFEIYFPAPLDLITKDDRQEKLYSAWVPEEAITSDLGNIRTPFLDSKKKLYHKQRYLISLQDMKNYLSSEGITSDRLVLISKGKDLAKDHVIDTEERVGIAIERDSRTSKDEYFYRIEHIRLNLGYSLGIGVDGLEDRTQLEGSSQVMRMGGEGKRVYSEAVKGIPLEQLDLSELVKQTGQLKMVMLQHADFEGRWYPPGFENTTEDGITVWKGKLLERPATLVTAIVGNMVQQGGWDLSKDTPRALRPLVPGGSVFYFKINPEDAEYFFAPQKLMRIGHQTNTGLGLCIFGGWKTNET